MSNILFYQAGIKAGFPSPAADYLEDRIDLTKVLIKNQLATFIIECTGDSMINAFIPHKALLVVDRSIEPASGHIVLAVLNGEFTVKFLKKCKTQCWLVPANEKYKQIEITPDMEMKVWGVVTHIITDTKELVKCMP
jgi:DNA polymerase V